MLINTPISLGELVDKISILIHPSSYIHAIVYFNNDVIKFLAHDTTMQIPILNSLYEKGETFAHYGNNFDINEINNNQ